MHPPPITKGPAMTDPQQIQELTSQPDDLLSVSDACEAAAKHIARAVVFNPPREVETFIAGELFSAAQDSSRALALAIVHERA